MDRRCVWNMYEWRERERENGREIFARSISPSLVQFFNQWLRHEGTRDRSIIVKKILDNFPRIRINRLINRYYQRYSTIIYILYDIYFFYYIFITFIFIYIIRYFEIWKIDVRNTDYHGREGKNPWIGDLTTYGPSSKSRWTRAGNSLQDKSTRLEISRFTWENKTEKRMG